LITNPDYSFTYPGDQGVFLFDRTYGNPWKATCSWNLDENRVEILPNMATPDLFRAYQHPSTLTDKIVRIWPCSSPWGGNIMGKQAPWNRCSDDCSVPTQITNSYAGIGYVFSYYGNNELKAPNSLTRSYQWSEYLVQKLQEPLVNGNIYKLSFKISKADGFGNWPNQTTSKNINLKYIGALLTNKYNPIPFPNSVNYETYPIPEPQWANIKVMNSSILDQVGLAPNYCNWMTISGYFKACNDMQFIYIGHFNNDIRQEIGSDFECKDTTYSCYYFISDVVLENKTQEWYNNLCVPTIPNCNSCSNGEKFKILAISEQINNSGCDKKQCCTKIKIQRTETGNWDCKFNFVKLNIQYSIGGTQKTITELIQITTTDYASFSTGNPIEVYRLCNDVIPEIRTAITVKAQLFNSTTELINGNVCEQYPGWWGPEVTSDNLVLACECDCKETSVLSNSRFHFDKDPADDCCYLLSLDNRSSNCDLYLFGVEGTIYVLTENGYEYIENQNDFSITLHDYSPSPNTWVERVPLWDNNHNFFLKYIPNPADLDYHVLRAGEKTDIAKFCVPRDGRKYKYDFFLSRDPNGTSGCKSPDYYVQCFPQSNNNCCSNIHVTQSSTGDCCFKIFIQVDNPTVCVPSKFNVFDVTETGDRYTTLIKGNVNYSDGQDYQQYKVFGPYCVQGNRTHQLRVDVYSTINGVETVCQTTLNGITCSTYDCCDAINVTPGTLIRNPDNYECCYPFNLSFGTGECSLKSLTITEGGLERASYTEPSLGAGLGNLVPYLCLPYTQGSHQLIFDFTLQNGLHCYKEIAVGCQDECCPNLHATVSQDPIDYDDGSTCCYVLDITVDPGYVCELGKIHIVDYADFLIKEIPEDNHVGTRSYTFCVSKDLFNGQTSLNLRIKFLDNNSYKLCETPVTINPCSEMKIPTPCTPDNQNVGWITKPVETIISFMCPEPPSPPHNCEVKLKFAYRHVVNGTETHRDVQVLNYTTNPGCDCDNKKIDEMINAMLSDDQVIGAFFVPEDVPDDGQEHWFDDFRVVASDCWTRALPLGDGGPSKRCSSEICCWARFRVYYKFENSKITYKHKTRIAGSDIIPENCPFPCEPRNCTLWIDDHGSGGSGRIQIGDEENKVTTVPCNVSFVNSENKDEISIKLECEQKGNIKFILSDLLGNVVFQTEYVKKSFSLTVPIKAKLISGIYFLRINLNDNMLYFNKFNIVR